MKKRFFALLVIPLLLFGSIYYQKHVSRPYLTVIGYAKMASGLGRQTVEVIDAFKDEMDVSFIPTHRTRYQDIPERLLKIIKRKKRPLGKVILFEDCVWLPGHSPTKKLLDPTRDDQIRIAYSMFESSRIPPEWTERLNTHFDAVAVPDPFLIKVYQESGVNLPIFVVPLAIDIAPFLQQPLTQEAHTPFTFANLSSCINRKNQLTLIRAFAKAFGNSDKVRLVINSRAIDNNLDEALHQEIAALGITNVQFTTGPLSKQEYFDLFQTVDCYINLAKGEGFSIQPREAMALGIPTIVSDNTGQSTLCKSGLVTPVPCSGTEPALYDWGHQRYGNFYTCTVDDAAVAMREVFDNYPVYLARSEKMRVWASQYLYENLKPLYRTLIKPKKVMLGDENRITEDALITDSLELFEKYRKI